MARAKKATTETEAAKTTRTKKKAEEATVPVSEENTVTVKQEEEVKAPKVVDQKDIEIENLKAQIEQLKVLVQEASQPKTVYVQTDNSERVWFLWLADVSDDNTVYIGENGQYGRIVGKTGTTYVPKNELSRVLDSSIRYYLENRWLIVTSGLTDEEREALGVNYKPGELLDEKAFRKIAELGEELIEIYPALCDSHKEMVACSLHEAFENHKHIDRNVIVELNKIHSDPALVDIIERMNAKEAEQHRNQ